MELNWRKARLLTLAALLTLLSNAYCSSKSEYNKEQKEGQKEEQKKEVVVSDSAPVKLKSPTWQWIDCTPEERYVLSDFEGRGKTVQQYMIPAYYWLGWGIKGDREVYSYNYSKKLFLDCC